MMEKWPKWWENGQNGEKMAKIVGKWPKWWKNGENGRKWWKIVRNGEKRWKMGKYEVQNPPRPNTSITSISHIRNHQGQYINHINQSYQKPPDKMSKGGHSDYWQNVFLTKRLTWIRPDKTSKVVRHSPDKTSKVVRPSWRNVILTKRLPDKTSADPNVDMKLKYSKRI